MADTRVSVIYQGSDSINFKCPGVFKANVQPGDVIENIPLDIFESEMKADPRYKLVSEKSVKGKAFNKIQKSTESEE